MKCSLSDKCQYIGIFVRNLFDYANINMYPSVNCQKAFRSKCGFFLESQLHIHHKSPNILLSFYVYFSAIPFALGELSSAKTTIQAFSSMG